MTKYSQRDVRWKDIPINGTKYTIGTDGCLLTCLGMVADVPPNEVVKKIGFTGAQVNWTNLDKIGLELVEKTNDYDNAKVLKYIAAYGQCIVRVDWDGSPKSSGDTHFVTYIGNQKLLDPWTGTERATSTYPLTTGIRAVRKIDMNADEIAVKKTDFENLVKKATMLDEILSKYGVPDAQGLYSMVQGKDSRITDLTNQLGTAQAEVNNRLEQVSRLKTEIDNLSNLLKERTDQVNQFARDKGELAVQVEQLKVQVDTLKQQATQGEVTLTFGELIKLLLQQKITIKK